MSTLRGCIVPDSAMTRNDAYGRQVDIFAQEFPYTRDPSRGETLHMNASGDNTSSVVLELLHTLPSRIAEGLGKTENTDDVFATLAAITTVTECCSIGFADDTATTAWQGVKTWLASVPDHFNQMVRSHHPAALVVLAFWAAMLVKQAERRGCWFLKGAAKITVLQVARYLAAHHPAVLGLVQCLMAIAKD